MSQAGPRSRPARARLHPPSRYYAQSLYGDPVATLDDVCEAVTSLEELAPYARRVLGGAHPTTVAIERALELAREAHRAREGTV